jgi:hypothetical protein
LRFDITGRALGKTYRALTWLVNTPNSVLIVINAGERFWVREHLSERYGAAKALELAERVVTLDEYQHGACRGKDVVVGIDNLDLMMGMLLGYPVKVDYVTATGSVRPTEQTFDVNESHRRITLIENEWGEAT